MTQKLSFKVVDGGSTRGGRGASYRLLIEPELRFNGARALSNRIRRLVEGAEALLDALDPRRA